jgi:hypothetical protein
LRSENPHGKSHIEKRLSPPFAMTARDRITMIVPELQSTSDTQIGTGIATVGNAWKSKSDGDRIGQRQEHNNQNQKERNVRR